MPVSMIMEDVMISSEWWEIQPRKALPPDAWIHLLAALRFGKRAGPFRAASRAHRPLLEIQSLVEYDGRTTCVIFFRLLGSHIPRERRAFLPSTTLVRLIGFLCGQFVGVGTEVDILVLVGCLFASSFVRCTLV